MTTQVGTSTIAPTAVVPGTYGSSTQMPIVTIGADGRVTTATTTTIGGGSAGGSGTTSFTRYTGTISGNTNLIWANTFTSNTFSYTPGYIQLFLNGILLEQIDYQATTGNTIILAANTFGGESIDVFAYTVASVSNINGGAPGTVIYQTNTNTTGNTAVGVSGQLLSSAGSGQPNWLSQSSVIAGNLVTTANVQIASIGVGTAPPSTAGMIYAANDIVAFFSSDISLKENVQPITNALATVVAIGGKTFDWKHEIIEQRGGDDGFFTVKHDFGVIAQDVEAVFPTAVRTRPSGIKVVDYAKLSALAFQAIIELKAEVDALKGNK
jgi:hypothetical protein